ncbi:uncharacterized protein TNCV_2415391 [Trichonephila clavipes]|nr:uncharacterized protein TNCV_2415391 [Trichonephila clavipes]
MQAFSDTRARTQDSLGFATGSVSPVLSYASAKISEVRGSIKIIKKFRFTDDIDVEIAVLPPDAKDRVAAVAKWSRYRIVTGLVTSSSPVPLNTRREGERYTLNLSKSQTSSRWCGVVVRRGGAS